MLAFYSLDNLCCQKGTCSVLYCSFYTVGALPSNIVEPLSLLYYEISLSKYMKLPLTDYSIWLPTVSPFAKAHGRWPSSDLNANLIHTLAQNPVNSSINSC